MPRLALSDFAGPSYVERSIGISADRTINMYPIVVKPDVRPPELALIGTPGLTRFCALAAGPVRLLHTCTNGRVFAVGGDRLYELFASGPAVERGRVTPGTARVSMDDNGLAAMLVDGTAAWVLTFATNAYAQVTDPDMPQADFVAFIDGYFAFNVAGTGRFGITGLYDPGVVDALDIATAEARADPLGRLIAHNRELRLFGTVTTESWFNSGNADFPFQAIQGTLLEQGMVARDGLVVLGNSLVWLHMNAQGRGKVLRMTGYQAEVVSSPPLEAAWGRYPTLYDATAWGYTASGHDFYVLTFPSGWSGDPGSWSGAGADPPPTVGGAVGVTWVLDLTTGFWHERAYLFPDGRLGRHRANHHCVGFGLHLVGDYETGTVYVLDEQATTDDGREIVRLRRFPHTRANRTRLFHGTLEIHVEQGERGAEAVEPRHLMLRWSNDGGHTYSAEHWRELGPVGAYRQRARWHKLGQARDRVYEVRSTAEAPARWIAAYLDGEGAA